MWALHNRKSDGSRAARVRIVAAWDGLRLPEVRPQTNLNPEAQSERIWEPSISRHRLILNGYVQPVSDDRYEG